jgi:hypothetical protein
MAVSSLLSRTVPAAAALLLAAAPLSAQHFRKIDKAPDMVDIERRVFEMRDGKSSARIPENKAALAELARLLAYRMTYPQALTLGTDPKKRDETSTRIDGVLIVQIYLAPHEAVRYLLPMPAANKLTPVQMEYVNEFGKQLTDRLKEVLTHPEPIVRDNAARMLSLIGRTGYEGIADTYADIINKEGDIDSYAVKFHALHGLRDLLAIPNPGDPTRSAIIDPGLERKAVKALIDFIQRKPPLPADATQAEVDAVRYVRREAVRALAQVHSPVFRSAGVIDSAPELTLLRVAVRDSGIVPEPSVPEQAEALLGLCQMADDQAVALDYLAYHVAGAVKELAIQSRDQPMVMPWRAYGTRLTLAMNGLKTRAGELPRNRGGDKVAVVADRAVSDFATYLEKPEGGARNAITTTPLDDWQKGNRPASTSLVRDDPKATVQARAELRRVIPKDDEDKPKKP